MATTRGIAPETLEKDVTHIFFNEFTRIDAIYSMLLKVDSSTKAFEDTFKVAGLGTFQLKPEGTPISYDNIVQGPRRRVTHSTYALGFRVTEEMRDDEQHGIINRMPEDLADSARNHQEVIAHSPFNTAFVTTNFTTMDNQAICSTTHVELKTGATVANELNPGVALSTNGIESMLIQIRKTNNDQGRPIRLTPKYLVIPTDLEFTAQRLMETEQQVGNNNNDINTVKSSRIGITPLASRYLTDVDDWWIQSAEHTATWYNRKELSKDSSVDAQTKDYLFDARYRASVVVWDWFGINGSSV
tara:strand:- start:1480 stop:2382 length:903 start_codon:yes stop_codon:yes gene_type:complete